MPEEKMRIEHDSMGEIAVPADKYWGAQTERSRRNFPAGAGHETMPEEILRAFAILKKAAAEANRALMPQRMTEEKCAAISRACDEILAGQLDGNFPLVVFQTGSGTQSNMNVNEVVANRGNAITGKKLLHPNDDVNMSQSSNDTFPTAMHIAAVIALEENLLPACDSFAQTLRRLEAENEDVLKVICRTPYRFASRRRSPAGARAWKRTSGCCAPPWSRCALSLSAAPPSERG